MTTSRGFTLLSVPMTLAAAAAGLALGIGAYAFHAAKGTSYLGNDPATCANCHVMQGHYAGWLAAWRTEIARSPALQELETLQRAAQWRLDIVAAENSMGFHAPQEMARILAESIDLSRQCESKARLLAGGVVAMATPAAAPAAKPAK